MTDPLHLQRVLSGIRPTRPSLTEAATGVTEHEQLAEKASLKDRYKDAMKRAKEYPDSKWGAHARKLKRKMQTKEELESDIEEAKLDPAEVRAKIKKGTVINAGRRKFIITDGTPVRSLKHSAAYRAKTPKGNIGELYVHFSPYGLSGTWYPDESKAKRGSDWRGKIEEAKRPTFKKAQEALMAYLKGQGWTIQTRNQHNFRPLKFPYAIDPHKEWRVWFKKQAIYLGGHHPGASLNDARSVHMDIRDMPPEEFAQRLKRWMR